MTGIERLRELIGDYRAERECDGIECEELACGPCMAKNVLEPIADQIEREHAEDADVVAWVREHGGLSHVKDICHDFRSVVERLGIEWSESELHGLMDALDRRLMPDGMEWLVEAWPRFEDGKPVRIGDEISWRDEGGAVNSIELQDGGYFTLHAADGAGDWILPQYSPGERIRRPAPKVLDADGAEIEVGDDLYSVEGSLKFHVSAIDTKGGRIATEAMLALDKWADPAMYTHRAPVLAADGRPLRDGETVWVTRDSPCDAPLDKGDEVTVRHAYPNNVSVEDKAGESWIALPDHLTHERPDSWERLEEDVAGASCPDVYCANHHIDANDTSYEWAMARDIVRRAKALAGDA